MVLELPITGTSARSSLFNLTLPELAAWLKEHGHPDYTASQVYQWLYQKRVDSFDGMTNLSKAMRSELAEAFTLDTPPLAAEQHDPKDETRKILLRLSDEEHVEAVLMPRFQGKVKTDQRTGAVEDLEEESIDAFTTCLSTQVGCSFACRFCASGQLGFTRNLNAGEILGQIMTFQRRGHPVSRIVFMGMGEPLHNFDELRRAIEILCTKEGLGFSARRITISTVGLVPEIYRMAQEEWKTKLAVSLHATTDEKRAELLPIARSYQIDQLKDALLYYQQSQGRRISFEYLMIEGFNDTVKDAERLTELGRGLVCHVNLIPYNKVPRMPFNPSPPDRIQQFRRLLIKNGVDVTVRYSRGRNIDAACGQLRLRHAS